MISKVLFSSAVNVPSKRIEFFYDVISPYTWFAFEVLMRYKKHWDVTIELKPFLLGAITKAKGGPPPHVSSKKSAYAFTDVIRQARYFNVPLKPLSDPLTSMFVKGSLIPSRFLTAVDLLYPESLESVTRALWMELWNKDEDITTPSVLGRAGKIGGLTDEMLLKVQKHMTEQVTKDRLKAHTTLASDYGAFGSPTMVAHVGGGDPILIFGSDRFPSLALEIGEKWLGPDPDSPESRL